MMTAGVLILLGSAYAFGLTLGVAMTMLFFDVAVSGRASEWRRHPY